MPQDFIVVPAQFIGEVEESVVLAVLLIAVTHHPPTHGVLDEHAPTVLEACPLFTGDRIGLGHSTADRMGLLHRVQRDQHGPHHFARHDCMEGRTAAIGGPSPFSRNRRARVVRRLRVRPSHRGAELCDGVVPVCRTYWPPCDFRRRVSGWFGPVLRLRCSHLSPHCGAPKIRTPVASGSTAD